MNLRSLVEGEGNGRVGTGEAPLGDGMYNLDMLALQHNTEQIFVISLYPKPTDLAQDATIAEDA
eukprot:6294617-Amphidinium_carterae.2